MTFKSVFEAFVSLNGQLRSEPLVQTRMGPYHEVVNLNLTVQDPLDRFAIFSNDWPGFENYLAAQWLWYATGQQDTWIKRFHPSAWERMPHESKDVNSNYGQYVWKEGQFKHCLNLLREDSSSRRAVIMLNRKEVAQSCTKDHICTTSLQFLIRNGHLHMITTMRSNELSFGFRTDVFFFTLLQEIMAVELGCHVGEYHHNVGSFHVAQDSNEGVCPLLRPRHCWLPRYERGELNDLLDPQLKGQFSLTQHFRKLMAFYEPSTDPRT